MLTKGQLDMLIDTHAHLYWDSYQDDFNDVIDRALKNGITSAINIGVDVETSQKAVDLKSDKISRASFSNQKIKFYSSIGIHPHEALRFASLIQGKFSDIDVSIHQDIKKLEQIYQSDPKKVVAVGECGLDYLFSINDLHPTATLTSEQTKELQRKLFQAQIDLAKKLNLPLLVHCRDDRSKNHQNSEAWDEVINMTKDYFGIYHCYSGLPRTTNYALQTTNFLFSFAGNITYPKNEYLREAIRIIPIDRIVVETDCPFLPPQTNRGKRNEPSYIIETVQTIADIKGLPIEEVSDVTYQNTTSLFKLA